MIDLKKIFFRFAGISRKTFLRGAMVGLGSFFLFSALSGSFEAQGGELPSFSAVSVRERGELRVALESENWGPFLQWNRGIPSGFCADLAQAVAEALGVPCFYVPLPWGNRTPGSISGILEGAAWGSFDIIASAVTVTPERSRWVHFSQPYTTVGQMVLLSKKCHALSLEELRGAWVGFPGNTTSEAAARKFLSSSKLIPLSGDASSSFAAFREGLVDVLVIDSPLALPFLEEFPEVNVLDKLLTRENYALVLPLSSDPEFRNLVDRVVSEQRESLENRWLR